MTIILKKQLQFSQKNNYNYHGDNSHKTDNNPHKINSPQNDYKSHKIIFVKTIFLTKTWTTILEKPKLLDETIILTKTTILTKIFNPHKKYLILTENI